MKCLIYVGMLLSLVSPALAANTPVPNIVKKMSHDLATISSIEIGNSRDSIKPDLSLNETKIIQDYAYLIVTEIHPNSSC